MRHDKAQGINIFQKWKNGTRSGVKWKTYQKQTNTNKQKYNAESSVISDGDDRQLQMKLLMELMVDDDDDWGFRMHRLLDHRAPVTETSGNVLKIDPQ